jgi:putative peptide zinc metalloprotease protein
MTDLIIRFQHKYHTIPFSRLESLIPRLVDHGFLSGVEGKMQATSAEKGIDNKISRFWEILMPIPECDRYFSILFGLTSRIFRSQLAVPVFILVTLFGIGYFVITEPIPRYPLLISESAHFPIILITYAGILVSAILHECGHAITCKWYGRRINNAGFVLYYGSPCLFVDTTDIWMAPPRARIITSLAGPAVNLFIGAACSLIVYLIPDSGISTEIWRFAFISYLLAMVNLNPLLEYDGYYALTDLLEIPNLRSRAFTFIRTIPLLRVIRSEKRLDKIEYIYLLYGIGGGLFSILMIITSLYIWEAHVQDLVTHLLYSNIELDHILTSLGVVLILLPFIGGLALQLISGIRDCFRRYRILSP